MHRKSGKGEYRPKLRKNGIQFIKPDTSTASAGNALRTYEQLRKVAQDFAAGAYNLLVITGEPGNGKTQTFLNALREAGDDDFAFISGTATARDAYIECYKHRNKPILFDDADTLTRTYGGVPLLKAIGNTDLTKILSYATKEMSGRNGKPPPRFQTFSPVAWISNEFEFDEQSGDAHSKAIGDRGTSFYFAPSRLETYQYVASWFWDQEIYDCAATLLPHFKHYSCRHYVKAWERKRNDLPGSSWQDYLRSQCVGGETTEFRLLEVMRQNRDLPRMKLIEAMVHGGGISQASVYRWLPALEPMLDLFSVDRITVQGKPPKSRADELAEWRRFGGQEIEVACDKGEVAEPESEVA